MHVCQDDDSTKKLCYSTRIDTCVRLLQWSTHVHALLRAGSFESDRLRDKSRPTTRGWFLFAFPLLFVKLCTAKKESQIVCTLTKENLGEMMFTISSAYQLRQGNMIVDLLSWKGSCPTNPWNDKYSWASYFSCINAVCKWGTYYTAQQSPSIMNVN